MLPEPSARCKASSARRDGATEGEVGDVAPDPRRLEVAEEPVPAVGVDDEADDAGDAFGIRRDAVGAQHLVAGAHQHQRRGADARGGGGGVVHQRRTRP